LWIFRIEGWREGVEVISDNLKGRSLQRGREGKGTPDRRALTSGKRG
jgi:hypothetical protein